MATRLSVGVFMLMVAATMLHISKAQTTHLVGGAQGWTIPPNGASTYPAWASSNTFYVGDVLVFNFTTGVHDVAEVTRAAFDGCNSNNTISLSMNGPTRITLNSTGAHYFICTFSGHCNLGQKLAINVSASSASPAPQPATPPPAAATPVATPSPAPLAAPTPSPVATTPPASAPTQGPTTYIVGDNLGWTVPPGGEAAYRTWAANKNFRVGDTLVFNFRSGIHDVAEVTRAAYGPCDSNNTIGSIRNTGPARITLTTPGQHFYICTFSQHCPSGQKLAINVTGTAATSPSGSPAPSTPPPSIATPPTGSTLPTTPSSPSPSGASPPPPQGSSAPSFAVALPVTFLSIVLALL